MKLFLIFVDIIIFTLKQVLAEFSSDSGSSVLMRICILSKVLASLLLIDFRFTYLLGCTVLVGRLPVAQVGPLGECRGPSVVHTGVSSPSPFTV